MKIGNKEYDFDNKTYVMGILNVTPNSFSDGGKFNSIETALIQAKKMIADGADIIDIGGESTHPTAIPITIEEELSRVIPVIEVLSKELGVLISIDTYKAEVAKQGVLAGAQIINDITGANGDPEMANVAASLDVPIILMQSRDIKSCPNPIEEIVLDLEGSISKVTSAGVSHDKIILDPGFGFNKTLDQNLTLIREIDKICALNYPVLVGASRKGTLSKVMNLPKGDLVEATVTTHLMAISKGCQIVRVHDVKEMSRAARMADAINKGEPQIGYN